MNDRWSALPGTSSCAVKTEGSAGARVFKFQWKQLAWDSNPARTANFQIWLHEADGSISYHYGPNTLPPASSWMDGGYTGIVVFDDQDPDALLAEINLEGRPGAPVIYRDIRDLSIPTLDSLPPNGTVYTFRRGAPAAVAAAAATTGFRLFPNPASDMLQLAGDRSGLVRAEVLDGTGRLVRIVKDPQQGSIDIRELAPGAYVLRLYSRSGPAAALVFSRLRP